MRLLFRTAGDVAGPLDSQVRHDRAQVRAAVFGALVNTHDLGDADDLGPVMDTMMVKVSLAPLGHDALQCPDGESLARSLQRNADCERPASGRIDRRRNRGTAGTRAINAGNEDIRYGAVNLNEIEGLLDAVIELSLEQQLLRRFTVVSCFDNIVDAQSSQNSLETSFSMIKTILSLDPVPVAKIEVSLRHERSHFAYRHPIVLEELFLENFPGDLLEMRIVARTTVPSFVGPRIKRRLTF